MTNPIPMSISLVDHLKLENKHLLERIEVLEASIALFSPLVSVFDEYFQTERQRQLMVRYLVYCARRRIEEPMLFRDPQEVESEEKQKAQQLRVDMRETIAATLHEEWSDWLNATSLYTVDEMSKGGWATFLAPGHADRLRRLARTPYAELTNEERQAARARATVIMRLLDLLDKYPPQDKDGVGDDATN